MMFRPLPVMTVLSVIAFAILIMFGNWQWGRYAEKMAQKGAEPDWAEITGTTLPGTEKVVYAYADGDAAWRQVTGFETAEGIIFLPLTITYSIEPPPVSPAAEPKKLTLRGLWHPPQRRNAFTTQDDPEQGIYYTLDPERLAASLPAELAARVIPRVFEPETLIRTDNLTSQPAPNPLLMPGDSERLPPERHFGYAITWWGLAMALAGVYLAFHHQRGRLRFRQEKS
ncbi:SURF1 family protein [Hyphomonas sp. NPDC076900]|uniref:SURF1 family protein n=1 Tax=unclassified Hyphomonas TaxID=2630699 RepID=UPI003CFD2BC0